MYFAWNDSSLVGRVARAAFPNNRKDFQVCEFKGPMPANSYWDGGSKETFSFVYVRGENDLRVIHAPTSTHPFFDRKQSGERVGELEIRELPPGVLLVTGGTFRGKSATVRVYVPSDALVRLLPQPNELPENGHAVLDCIAGTKGGAYRREEFHRRGLGEYGPTHPVILQLADLGLLKITKNGAVSVTTEGRNARATCAIN